MIPLTHVPTYRPILETMMEDVVIHLQQYRKETGITLRQLESQAKYPRSSLHRFEHKLGTMVSAFEALGRISHTLNIAPWLIVEYPDWPIPVKACPCQDATRKREQEPTAL
jgi:hypothetical protein